LRILIVDDETALREQLEKTLSGQRYMVETASNGEEALDRLFDAAYDLIILDIMMPGTDGFMVLENARKAGVDTPVIMLTARGDVDDRVKGLDLGADDYLAKPFSADELLARIRALFRRSGGQSRPLLQVSDLVLDTVRRQVSRGENAVELTPREFSILEFLLYNKNRAVSRFSLAEHVWGDDFDAFNMSNFIDVHIKNLRHKIGDSGHGQIIQTLRGVGYIIQEPDE